MSVNIGDKVKFLSAVGGGTVSGFRKDGFILVEDEDGFEIPVKESEVVVASPAQSARMEQSTPSETTKDTSESKKTEYGKAPAHTQQTEEEYIGSLEKRIIRLEMMVHTLESRIERLESGKVQKEEKKRQDLKEREQSKDGILEVDLHIDKLLDDTTGMSASNIKDYQMKVFRQTMDANKGKKGLRIIFIHGNGDGVLRKAILNELKYSYKQCSWQDASFQQYGFGATMVIMA